MFGKGAPGLAKDPPHPHKSFINPTFINVAKLLPRIGSKDSVDYIPCGVFGLVKPLHVAP